MAIAGSVNSRAQLPTSRQPLKNPCSMVAVWGCSWELPEVYRYRPRSRRRSSWAKSRWLRKMQCIAYSWTY